MGISCIYSVENKINGKRYIGQAVDYERRVKEHQSRYSKDNSKSTRSHFYRAIRKYGIENFTFSILEECSIEELNALEKKYIKEYDTFKNGYNMTEGGQNDKPNRKLEEEDVIFLRELYNSKTELFQRDIWEDFFKEKVTFNYFRSLWKGYTWQDIMPEVFTEENKKFYQSKVGSGNRKSAFSDVEVLELRKRYVTESAASIAADYEDRISLRGMEALLRGQNYQHLPIYKKREKRWVNNNIDSLQGGEHHGEV